jgi:hypothetical protein
MTVYVEDEVLAAVRVAARRGGKSTSQLVDEALRSHLRFQLLERVGGALALERNESLTLAGEERHG